MEIIALYNEYEIPDTLPKYNNLCFYNFFPTDNIGLSVKKRQLTRSCLLKIIF